MLEGVVINDTELFNDRLQEWERFCNFNRLHGSLGTRRRKRCSGRREGPSVNGHRQLHTGRLQGPGVRIGWNPAEQCCFKYR
jgi:hypothetical protein